LTSRIEKAKKGKIGEGIQNMKKIMASKQKQLKTDVTVVGGGVAVLTAAAVARAGIEVYPIEKNGFLIGTALGGFIARFQSGPDVKRSPQGDAYLYSVGTGDWCSRSLCSEEKYSCKKA
jgi:hypothetical protein